MVKYHAEKTLKASLASIKSNQVIVINNDKKNIGFAKAVNQGIKKAIQAGAEAVFLLNPDAHLVKGQIADLFKEKADIVAPVIKDKNNMDYGGGVDWRWGRVRHSRKSIVDSRKIDYVSGCAMLIKKAVWEKIGFLDERFFLYYEDVDYCLRATRAGFRVAVTPLVQVVHALTEPQDRPIKQNWHLIKSHWLFLRKYHFGLRAYFYWLALTGKILARCLARWF